MARQAKVSTNDAFARLRVKLIGLALVLVFMSIGFGYVATIGPNPPMFPLVWAFSFILMIYSMVFYRALRDIEASLMRGSA